MRTYMITVFSKSGETLLSESFEAENDDAAKEIGEAKLKEQDYLDQTHRCISSDGKLILFHV